MRTPEKIAEETDIKIIESEMDDWHKEMSRLSKEMDILEDKYNDADIKFTLWHDALQIKNKLLSTSQSEGKR